MDGSAKQAAAGLQVKKVGANIGAAVTGVDLTKPLDDTTFQEIHDAWCENEVLVFPDQDITPEQQMAFGARFGELTVHPFAPNDAAAPEMIVYDNNPDNPPFGTDNWHSDETFRLEPPMGTMLRSLEVPDVGGDTMFASMTTAYDALSDRMQHFIDDLVAVHDYKVFRRLFSADKNGRENLRRYDEELPLVMHPVVRIHPVTGKKAIFVSSQFTLYIEGMKERESQNILDTLYRQAEIPELQYRHHWEANVGVLWDNRSAQHYAVHDYLPERRYMNRITMRGDRPFGPAGKSVYVHEYHDAKAGPDDREKYGGHGPQRQHDRALTENG